jgi:hypothetical protein
MRCGFYFVDELFFHVTKLAAYPMQQYGQM